MNRHLKAIGAAVLYLLVAAGLTALLKWQGPLLIMYGFAIASALWFGYMVTRSQSPGKGE